MCALPKCPASLVIAAMVTALVVIFEPAAVAMPTPLHPVFAVTIPGALQQPHLLRSCQHLYHEIPACTKSSFDPALNQHLLPDITWIWSVGLACFQ